MEDKQITHRNKPFIVSDPLPILTHTDPYWPILTHTDPYWPILYMIIILWV
jgi:hypothetical protein